MAARRAPDAGRVEHRALEENPRRALAHLAALPAHHAGQRDRLRGVGDDQVVGEKLALLAVERRQELAFARAPHDDAGAVEAIEIERVQRVSQLEQRQVGRVHHAVDGPHAARAQPLLHGERRGPDAHALDDARHVSRTALRVLDLDARRQLALPRRRDERQPHRCTDQRRQLARDAEVRKRVGAVGGDVDLEDGVGQAQHLVERLPQRSAGREDQEPGVIVGEPELARRAEHAAALDAAELRRLDGQPARQHRPRPRHGNDVARRIVLRSAQNLMDAGAVVHLADAQVIAALDGLARDDLRDDHARPEGARLAAFDLHAGEGEPVRDLVVGQIDRAQLAQPAQRDLHSCSRKRASFSKSRRRSSMPWRSMARRSMPTPKA